jgi:hypothetical protein
LIVPCNIQVLYLAVYQRGDILIPNGLPLSFAGKPGKILV